MSSPVISVRGLGKKYRLGETIRHDTLRDKIAHSLKSLFAKKENSEARSAKREAHPNLPPDPQSAIPNCPPLCPSPSALRPPELPSAPHSAPRAAQSSPEASAPPSALRPPPSAEFWALKDVSFDVQQGEVVGIIGRNGAGKSTLLKILSQITEPTEGEIRMRGRVASLLEVGTGFHPELTGRENIFLNGAILGMARSEIRKKFDEIVAFAEVEKFIDTPVKRYSSGMYVRLAFAVAAHLEPEILIVDEVLSVGDTAFQHKCLGKMEEVSKGGRTILFVSHHLPSVQRLCSHGIYLQSGTLSVAGTAHKAIESYLSSSQMGTNGRRNIRINNREARITSWEIVANNESRFSSISREIAIFRFIIESGIPIPNAQIGFVIRSLSGDLIVAASSRDDSHTSFDLTIGRTEVRITVKLPLKMGRYQLEVALTDEILHQFDHWIAQPFLTIIPSQNSVLPEEWRGLLNEPVKFSFKSL